MTASVPPNDVDVSVIVPFSNVAPHLGDLLESLVTQDVSSAWEVVAVDNGSSDGSREIAESYAARLPVRVVDGANRRGAGHARNVGARHARGRKLLFLDADDAVAPGYLAAMDDALDRHAFVTSAFDHETLNPDWVRHAHGPVWRDPDDPVPALFGLLPFAGGSVGIIRETFERAGGYPEDFARAQDIAFSWEVQLQGTELHYVPDAVYRVRYRSTLGGLFHQSLDWGAALPLLYRRYQALGMTRRPLRHTARMWLGLVQELARARSRADLAPIIVRAGLLIGRVRGSVRHRVYFL